MQVKWKMIHKHKHKWNDGIKRYENKLTIANIIIIIFSFDEKNVLCNACSGVSCERSTKCVFFSIVFDQVTIVISFELKLSKDFVISRVLWENHSFIYHTQKEKKPKQQKSFAVFLFKNQKFKWSENHHQSIAIVYENVMTQMYKDNGDKDAMTTMTTIVQERMRKCNNKSSSRKI